MDDFFNDLLTYDSEMLETAIGGMETMTEGGESAEAYKLVVAVCKDIIARRGGGAAAMDTDTECQVWGAFDKTNPRAAADRKLAAEHKLRVYSACRSRRVYPSEPKKWS